MGDAGDSAVTKTTLDPALREFTVQWGDRPITRLGQPTVLRARVGKTQGIEGAQKDRPSLT